MPWVREAFVEEERATDLGQILMAVVLAAVHQANPVAQLERDQGQVSAFPS
jgi:hypothetical protein